jgi:DNA/RNA endonuclease G (NUC1)
MKKLLIILVLYTSLAEAQVVTVKHARYTAAFSQTLLYPILVKWTITVNDVCKKGTYRYVSRDSSKFIPDPQIPLYTNLQKYYDSKNSFNPHKWQRGHNCPANDNSCNKLQMDECHYFSNMTPQNEKLNQHRWALLEAYASKLASKYDVKVWCGSYGEIEKMGPISVPMYCWKIIKYNNKEEVYIFPNVDTVMRHKFDYYKSNVTAEGVAKIRKNTGLILKGL